VKKSIFILLTTFLCASVFAQTVTIRFEGTKNSTTTNARSYIVDLDGRVFNSNTAENVGNAGIKQIVLTDLAPGSHKLTVHENSTTTNDDALLYSNTFELRSNYDMVIAVRRNGTVSFTEKKMKAVAASSTVPMTNANFTKLLQTVKAKWSQSSKVSAIKSSIATKANYFSTDQVGELLLLVSSEANRLELAKLAYPKVTDPLNYYDVADLFNTQANKDNITAFVQSKNPGGSLVTTNTYPSRIAMSDSEFSKLQTKATLHFRQSSTVADIKAALNTKTNYFTVDQLRSLLSMVTSEANRLELAKLAWHRSADPNSFTQLYDMFTQASITTLNTYIKNNPS
jgi:hypothetical protein